MQCSCDFFVPAKEKREQKPAPVNRPPTVLRHYWLVGEVMDIIYNNWGIASLNDSIENTGIIPKQRNNIGVIGTIQSQLAE